MPQFGICQWCMPGRTRVAKIEACAQCGLDGIELDLGPFENGLDLSSGKEMAECCQAAFDHGFQLPSISVNALCTHGMSRPESGPVVREILERAIRCANKMSIRLIQLPSFGNGAIRTNEELVQTAACLTFACDYAADFGITIGTENALSADRNSCLLQQVNRSNLKIYFDTGNPKLFSDLDPAGILRDLISHVCEIHVKDGLDSRNCRFLGEGSTGFAESMETLKSTEYKGWIHLENNYSLLAKSLGISVQHAITKDLEVLRSFWGGAGKVKRV